MMRIIFGGVARNIRMNPWRSAASAAVCCAVAVVLWLRLGPIPPELLDLRETTSTIVVDRQGVPLYEALSGDGSRSVHLTASNLPTAIVAATLAAEDRRFWSHYGVDPIAMLRAARQNIAERRIVEGGSTITQQVAKLLLNRRFPQRHRGWKEKIREAVLAVRLEHRFNKREILALYLNLAGYGNQIVGVERASRAYFGHDATMLTTAQAAFLAGLPQRPSSFNPYRGHQSATIRQHAVIRRMEAAGAITASQAAEARSERLLLTRFSSPFLAPHFVEMVLTRTDSEVRPARIETTLDAGLQTDIAGIISSQRGALDRIGAANVAVVVLDNLRGEWIAWEGSGDYFDTARGGAINGPTTLRQPGSALKPFTYALALEEGLTPASVLPDIPSHFPTAEAGVLYSPRNYDGRYRGPLLVRRALAGSENVPAVALASHLGVPKLLRFLARAGFTSFDRNPSYYGLGVTLGNAEVRLDELVSAYSVFARGGEWVRPTWTRDDDRSRQRLISPRTAYWITDILSDPDAREYIFGRGGNLEFPFAVAVKTGTSQAYHDNWTIGYTRDLTVGVWVGNFDRTPLRNSTGVSGAGPIFHSVMLAAARRSGRHHDTFGADTIVTRPDGMVDREFCSLSGMLANAWCPSRQREWVATRDAPSCDWHHMSDAGTLVIWPAEYRQWARENGLLTQPTGQSPPARITRTLTTGPSRKPADLEISNPPSGATYLIDPTLRPEFQTLSLRVVASRPGQIEWRINGNILGTTSSESPWLWPLKPGIHQIAARDDRGHTAQATITVR